MGEAMSYEVYLLRANRVTEELEALALVERCATREEAEEMARDLNMSEDLDRDEFYYAVEREDEDE